MWNWWTGSSILDPARVLLRLEALEAREVPAILIQVDYTFDTGFFTNNPDARAVMERVAAELGNSISANLTAITPSGGNTWTASFFNPATGSQTVLPNLTVGANAIKLFVGGRPIAGSEAGFGGYGGYGVSGSQPWINTVQTRGWGGFSLWGGSIAFDTSQNWHFGQSTDGLTGGKLDFYSVATHELGHVLGLGTANQWTARVSGGYFRGANAMAVYGGPVPLAPGGAHFADGATAGGQSLALDPTLTLGQRVGFSALDAAALRDLGWAGPSTPGAPAPAPPFTRVPLAAGPTVAFTGGTDGVVALYNVAADGALADTGQRLTPFAGFAGAIRVAGGDFNGDGVQDFAFTTGAGPQAVIQIMDGRDGGILVGQTAIFPGFRGGLFLAAADIDRDGHADLVVSADAGAGPHIQTFRIGGGALHLQSSFFAFDNPAYRGGARVAAGDINRDGFADVVVTTGGLAEGRVAMYSGADLASGVATRLIPDFHPFAGGAFGLNAAVGDMDGDGFGELAVVPDRGGPAHVKLWSGAILMTGAPASALPLTASFYGLPPGDPSGGRLALRDLDGNGRADLVVSSGNPRNSVASVFNIDQAIANGGGAPITFPLGTPYTYDGVFAGLHAAEAPTSGDATDTITAVPPGPACACGACRALALLANAGDELLETIPVM